MKIAVEIDFGKVLVVAGMTLCTWLASLCGEGEVLFFIYPAGIGYLLGLWKENENE